MEQRRPDTGFGAKDISPYIVYLEAFLLCMSRTPAGNGESTLFGNKPFAADEMSRIQTILNRSPYDIDIPFQKSNESSSK